MNRSSLPLGVNSLKKWWDSPDKILRCSLPFQRHSGMWNAITKSMLVWSILADSYIPPIVLLKDKKGVDSKNKDIFTYQVLDGQQRLTTLFSFINDEWSLHGSTPEVEVEGTVYDLEGIKFSEMSDECKDAIKNYRFTVQCLENYTMSEAESLFYNINSGVSLSTIQKSKAKLGTDLIGFLNGLLQGSFFTQAINITEKQALAEDDLLLLLQGMLLLDNRHEGMDYKNISMATCLAYAESIRGSYSDEKRSRLGNIVKYLDEAFDSWVKFLKKNNVPIVIAMAEIALSGGMDARSFRAFVNDFANGIYPAYEEASGSGNVKAVKVQQRLRVMYLAMCDYYRINPLDYEKPFAEGIPLYLDGMSPDENTETDSGEPSPVAESENEGENPECGEQAEVSSSSGVESDAGDSSESVSGEESIGE
ncbi:MAG: DUF262 domain-containing protein, partial [Lachnospiraceae bacterium]|nr:DUF262 domain-containing protein [Lachnospiraceae bacterium]